MELREIIEREYKHPYYKEATSVAGDAMVIHTQDPEKQREQLARYRGGEEKSLLDQRVKLHNPITAPILAPALSYQAYIYRADGIKKRHECPDKKKKEWIDDNFARFYGEQSLHEYLYQAITHYNNVDPGAFIGFDRENILNQSGELDKIGVYPVEFPSSQVVGFKYNQNGTLQQLTALRMFTGVDTNGKKTVPIKEYRHYYAGGWVVAYEVTKEGVTHPSATIENGFTATIYTIGRKPVTFMVKEGANGTKEVPFFCVGAYDHPEYRGKVKATFTHDSTGILFALMRDDNFLAVQKAVHCFPDRSEYVKPCTHTNEQGESCHSGYYGGVRDVEHTCRACSGLGYMTNQSEQKVTRLKWPDNASDLVELSKTKHYHERPLEIAEFYVSEIRRQQELVFSTTYNQNNVKPTGSARTATEVNLNADLINNKLTPLAGKIEDGYELAHRIAHQYYGVKGGDVELSHPSDFKVLTIDELITQHGSAITAQLPSAVRSSIVDDILAKQYRNFPDVKADIQAFESWKPWSDKTSEETVLIVSGRGVDDFYRKLWENWDAVVNQVKFNLTPDEYEPKFYLLSRKLQQAEVTKALDEVLGLVSYVEVDDTEPLTFDLGGQNAA